jgi:hypothetical protein
LDTGGWKSGRQYPFDADTVFVSSIDFQGTAVDSEMGAEKFRAHGG